MVSNGNTIVFRLKSTRSMLSMRQAQESRSRLLERLSAKPVFPDRSPLGMDSTGMSQLFVVSGGDDKSTLELLDSLNENVQVELAYVAPPRDVLVVKAPANPCHQWWRQVRLDVATQLPQWQGKSPVSIALLDSGVDIEHQQLGHINLVKHGSSGPASDDPIGHGSHVAGLIAAVLNDDNGFEGIFPTGSTVTMHQGMVKPYEVDVYYRALRSCIGAKVINLSVGGEQEDPIETELVRQALDAGSIVIAAIGNHQQMGSPPIFPAELPGVIAVAAVDGNNQQAEMSNCSEAITVAAPGVDIWSTVPTYPVDNVEVGAIPPLAKMSGTSMATPIVSAIVAKMLAYRPGMDRNQVVEFLKEIQGTRDVPDLGIGVIDAYATLAGL